MTEKSFRKKNIFHTTGSAKLLTASFVAGEIFYSGRENEISFDVTLSGVLVTTLVFQLEISHDGEKTWDIVDTLPNDGEMDGSTNPHNYVFLVEPDKRYRPSFKAIGGDATSAAFVQASSALPGSASGTRAANSTSVDPNYDKDSNSARVLVLNQWSKYFHGAPLVEETDIPDTTLYYSPWLNMDGVRDLSIQLTIAGSVVVTAEASNQDEGAPPADGAGEDITLAVFGSATFTSSGFMFTNPDMKAGCIKWIQLKYVTSGGATGDNLKAEPRGID